MTTLVDFSRGARRSADSAAWDGAGAADQGAPVSGSGAPYLGLLSRASSPRVTSPAARTDPRPLRAALSTVAAAVGVLALLLAASVPWTALPLAAALFAIWILTPSEADRAVRSTPAAPRRRHRPSR